MAKKMAAAALCGLVVLGGCSTVVPNRGAPVTQMRGAELVGQNIRVESAGRTSTMTFRRDGTVIARFGEQQATGNWDVQPGKLCFAWGSVRDCWPYLGALERGRTVTLTSDRGNVVRVTLL